MKKGIIYCCDRKTGELVEDGTHGEEGFATGFRSGFAAPPVLAGAKLRYLGAQGAGGCQDISPFHSSPISQSSWLRGRELGGRSGGEDVFGEDPDVGGCAIGSGGGVGAKGFGGGDSRLNGGEGEFGSMCGETFL